MIPAALLLALGAAPAAAGTDPVFAVRGEMYLGDGKRVSGGVLVVEGGKIRAAGGGVEVPAGTPVVEHDGVVTAGMIACHSFDGAGRESSDETRSVLPGARMAHAFDPGHSGFETALAAGITAMVLAPSAANLVGGTATVVKTAGGRVVAEDAHLALSFSSQALSPNRFPTSSSGALAELEELMRTPDGALAEAAAGRRLVLLDAGERDEIQRAIGFATRHGLRGALNRAPRAGELVEEVRKSGLAVIVGPLGVGADRKVLRSVVELGQAGVPLAFGLDAPHHHADSLRVDAALCVREGLDPTVAWRALTSDGARIAGVDDRLGSLDRGLDADFVLWSGDPLDLASEVVEVYVDGVRVYRGER